jgi:ketosteroid isomerase-like protein
MTQQDDHKVLEKLNSGYVRAVQDKDVAWFDQHLSWDFHNTASDGTLADRKTFLAQIAKGTGVAKIKEEDVLIRITGDTAIIHAATAFSTDAGASGRGRYTDIWQKQNGRWLCVAAHVSRRANA